MGDRITKMAGKSLRPGVYNCKDCRKPFSVTVGTVMERAHISLSKWALATRLMAASKKGMSAHQLHRMMDVSYEAAWFLFHRLREAMRESDFEPLGGEGKFVEADETFTGGKAKNRAYKAPPPKEAVMALVERGGKVRSYHVPEVTAATLKPIIVDTIAKDSHFRTDESGVYWKIGEEFASHETVIHSINEYVRGDAPTNTIEGYFYIFKRGIYGVHHHVSQDHLNDADRAAAMLRGAKGKRLLYRQPDGTANA
jgi:hypothetical protein